MLMIMLMMTKALRTLSHIVHVQWSHGRDTIAAEEQRQREITDNVWRLLSTECVLVSAKCN